MGKGFVRSYKHITIGNWGLQQDRQQFHFGTGLPQGLFKKAQLHPAVRFKNHTGKRSHLKTVPMYKLNMLQAILSKKFALK